MHFQKWESAGLRGERFCPAESEPKTKGGFGAVSPVATIVFSSETLSSRAQEQLRQRLSKVKGRDKAGKSREPSGESPGVSVTAERTDNSSEGSKRSAENNLAAFLSNFCGFH